VSQRNREYRNITFELSHINCDLDRESVQVDRSPFSFREIGKFLSVNQTMPMGAMITFSGYDFEKANFLTAYRKF
jgi:hypothetical protein